MPLGIGLIGLGHHGARYARHLLDPVPNARLVAVCRRNAELGKAFAAEHRLRFYQDYRHLIADADVQAVIVVTPPNLTRAICLEAVRAGKPLLIEKPLACTGADAREMVQSAANAGVPLMTAQTLRFDPAVVALKDALTTAGARRYLALTTRVEPDPKSRKHPADYAGRGALLELGIHLFDLIRFLTGEEVTEVRCDLNGFVPGTPESRAWVSLRTTGGLPCILDVSRVGAGRIGRAEWIGERAQVIADWSRHRLCRISSGYAVEEWAVPDCPTILATLRAFLDAIEHGRPMPVTGRDGQKAVEIADACYESAVSGRNVRLQ